MEKGARYIVKGAIALAGFLGPAEKAVDHDLAQKRADVCKKCPMNRSPRAWVKTIDRYAAKATKQYFRWKSDLNLQVDGEEQLGICKACWCPLKLKVHVPVEYVLDNTDEEILAEFHPMCWITEEMSKVQK